MSSAEVRSEKIIDANDRARKANHFESIKLGRTQEYRALIQSLDTVFQTSEQKGRAFSYFKSGMATTAEEAMRLMQAEDLEDKNTHR